MLIQERGPAGFTDPFERAMLEAQRAFFVRLEIYQDVQTEVHANEEVNRLLKPLMLARSVFSPMSSGGKSCKNQLHLVETTYQAFPSDPSSATF